MSSNVDRDRTIQKLERKLRDVTAERDDALKALRGLASFAYSIINPVGLPDAYHQARRIIEADDKRAALERVEGPTEEQWVENAEAYLKERVEGRG